MLRFHFITAKQGTWIHKDARGPYTDFVSIVEKDVPPISESTARRILDSISQDEQDTHGPQIEATFDSNDA